MPFSSPTARARSRRSLNSVRASIEFVGPHEEARQARRSALTRGRDETCPLEPHCVAERLATLTGVELRVSWAIVV